jgi:hypothetical protein
MAQRRVLSRSDSFGAEQLSISRRRSSRARQADDAAAPVPVSKEVCIELAGGIVRGK